jgi:hypothetical protein
MLFSFRQFFWRGFLFVCWLAALLFFFLHFKKNKCAAMCVSYKNHDKKTDCNTEHRPCILAVLAVLVCGLFGFC